MCRPKVILSVIIAVVLLQSSSAQSVQLMTPQIREYLNTYYDALETADAQKALQALNALIAADPAYPHYYGARASVLEAMPGSSADSILADLDRAIQADTTIAQWQAKRAAFGLQIGTDRAKQQSVADLLQLCARDSVTLSYRTALLPLLVRSDSIAYSQIFEQAVVLAYQQVTLQPDQASAWYDLASVYCVDRRHMQEEDVLLALGYLEKALSLDPAQSQYALLRAEIYLEVLHNLIAAIEDLRYILNLSPSPAVYAALAEAYAESGQKKQALQVLDEGFLLFPGSYTLEAAKRRMN